MCQDELNITKQYIRFWIIIKIMVQKFLLQCLIFLVQSTLLTLYCYEQNDLLDKLWAVAERKETMKNFRELFSSGSLYNSDIVFACYQKYGLDKFSS